MDQLMEKVMEYVKPELVVVAVVLYFLGVAFKKAEAVKDKYIPLFLGAAGIVLCAVYVLATSTFNGWQSIVMAVFTSVVQGVLVAGLSTYANQVIKQTSKEE